VWVTGFFTGTPTDTDGGATQAFAPAPAVAGKDVFVAALRP
jgi:hypothetical protein